MTFFLGPPHGRPAYHFSIFGLERSSLRREVLRGTGNETTQPRVPSSLHVLPFHIQTMNTMRYSLPPSIHYHTYRCSNSKPRLSRMCAAIGKSHRWSKTIALARWAKALEKFRADKFAKEMLRLVPEGGQLDETFHHEQKYYRRGFPQSHASLFIRICFSPQRERCNRSFNIGLLKKKTISTRYLFLTAPIFVTQMSVPAVDPV